MKLIYTGLLESKSIEDSEFAFKILNEFGFYLWRVDSIRIRVYILKKAEAET